MPYVSFQCQKSCQPSLDDSVIVTEDAASDSHASSQPNGPQSGSAHRSLRRLTPPNCGARQQHRSLKRSANKGIRCSILAMTRLLASSSLPMLMQLLGKSPHTATRMGPAPDVTHYSPCSGVVRRGKGEGGVVV